MWSLPPRPPSAAMSSLLHPAAFAQHPSSPASLPSTRTPTWIACTCAALPLHAVRGGGRDAAAADVHPLLPRRDHHVLLVPALRHAPPAARCSRHRRSQPRGSRFTLRVSEGDDGGLHAAQTWTGRSSAAETAVIRIPELEFEIGADAALRGDINTAGGRAGQHLQTALQVGQANRALADADV